MSIWVEILVQIFVYVIISYAIFYKAFLKSFGKEKAKLATIEELAKIEQSVKEDFNNKLESIRAELAKNNINYQITLGELIKRRFDHIENLVISLIKVQDFIKDNMFTAENDEQYNSMKREFLRLSKETDSARKVCNLYIPQEMTEKIRNAVNSTYDAYLTFLKMYRTDPKKLNIASKSDVSTTRIAEKLSKENFIAFEKLNQIIEEFPIILTELSNELKKEMFFKGID